VEFTDHVELVDQGLELAIVYEPPTALDEDILGLDDVAIRRVVALTLARVGVTLPVELSVLVTDDARLQALNREYRGKDEATDILSFPLLDAPLLEAPEDQLWQMPEEADGAEDAGVDDELEDETGVSAAFPVLEEDNLLHLGDIALSRRAVERQAVQAGHSSAWELAYVLAHGVLHLVGYDDLTDAGYRAMVAHQEAVLAAMGLPENEASTPAASDFQS
jgi:probable rRNA maturation factor